VADQYLHHTKDKGFFGGELDGRQHNLDQIQFQPEPKFGQWKTDVSLTASFLGTKANFTILPPPMELG
jgi:hypothetical protein